MIRHCAAVGNAARGAHDYAHGCGPHRPWTRMRSAQSCFHAESPEQIAFTCNDTEALNTAFSDSSAGDRTITTVCEHNSVLHMPYALEKQGLELS